MPQEQKVNGGEAVAAGLVVATLAMEWATQPEIRPMFQEWAAAKGCPIEGWSSGQMEMLLGVVEAVTEEMCHKALRDG